MTLDNRIAYPTIFGVGLAFGLAANVFRESQPESLHGGDPVLNSSVDAEGDYLRRLTAELPSEDATTHRIEVIEDVARSHTTERSSELLERDNSNATSAQINPYFMPLVQSHLTGNFDWPMYSRIVAETLSSFINLSDEALLAKFRQAKSQADRYSSGELQDIPISIVGDGYAAALTWQFVNDGESDLYLMLSLKGSYGSGGISDPEISMHFYPEEGDQNCYFKISFLVNPMLLDIPADGVVEVTKKHNVSWERGLNPKSFLTICDCSTIFAKFDPADYTRRIFVGENPCRTTSETTDSDFPFDNIRQIIYGSSERIERIMADTEKSSFTVTEDQ